MKKAQKTALRDVVTIDPETMHGTPCFTGTRIPVQTFMDFLEDGDGVNEFLAVYPSIPREQLIAFLEFGREWQP